MLSVTRQSLLAFFVAMSIGSICVLVADRILKGPDARPVEVVAKPHQVAIAPILPPVTPQEKTDHELQPKVCDDPEIRPIWNAIRLDKEVRQALDGQASSSNCRDAFEIGYFDLNRDGKQEILARAIGIPFCGAVGNCDVFVLQKTRKGLRLLLHADDYTDATEMKEQLSQSRTNGYLDITTKGHFSASETSYTTYKFNGRKYVEISCKYEIATYDRDNKLALESISCKEFYRRLDRDLKQSDQVVNRR